MSDAPEQPGQEDTDYDADALREAEEKLLRRTTEDSEAVPPGDDNVGRAENQP